MEEVVGLMDALKAGGPYALSSILLIGLVLERRDRQEKESHLRAVYEKTVTLAIETTQTVEKMQSAVSALTDVLRLSLIHI